MWNSNDPALGVLGLFIRRICCSHGDFWQSGRGGGKLDLATLIRTVIIFIVLTGIVTAAGQWRAPSAINAKTWIFLALSGLATGASWIAYYRALKLGNASQVAPVDKLSIVLVVIFGVVFLGEKVSLAHWAAVMLIAAGAIMLAVF